MARSGRDKAPRRRRRLLSRLFGGHKNRRLGARLERSSKTPEAEPAAEGSDERGAEAAPPRRRPQRGRGRTLQRVASVAGAVGRGALVAAKLSVLLAALAAVGLGGYYGYQKLQRSTYFDVDTLVIKGTRHSLPSELEERIAGAKGRSIFDIDLDAVAAAVQRHDWVAGAKVIRQLPRTLRVEVREHRVQAALVLDGLYLVSSEGDVFKRAETAEAEGLPLVTGLSRRELKARPAAGRRRIETALAALTAYQRRVRPSLSEVHVGEGNEVTFFLRKSGTALRFGKAFSPERLRKLDAVWAALGPDARRARALYLDHEVRGDRVVVRMAGASSR